MNPSKKSNGNNVRLWIAKGVVPLALATLSLALALSPFVEHSVFDSVFDSFGVRRAEAASFVNTAVPSNPNLSSGLQLYYSFDSTKVSTTTVTDESGNAKNGTYRKKITFDAASAIQQHASFNFDNGPFTWNHTTTANADRILIVTVSYKTIATPSTSVTYGEVPMTLVSSYNYSTTYAVEMWYLKNPPSGTKQVAVYASGTRPVVTGSSSFYGVDQTQTITGSTAGTSATSISVTVNGTNSSQIVVDSNADLGVCATKDASQTLLYSGCNDHFGGSSWKVASESNTTMQWTDDASSARGIIAIPLSGTGGKTPGKIGQALKFDGITASTTIGNVSSTVKSVAFWAKVATSTTAQNVMDLNGNGINVRIVSGVVTANGFTSPTIYVDGAVSSTLNNTNWHHVVITSGTAVNASNVSLGVASSTYYGGTLDDLRMYNRALTAVEVTRLYGLGGTSYINTAVPSNTANASGLVLQYSFDGTTVSTSTVSDVSGNGKTGTGQMMSSITFRAATSSKAAETVTPITIDKPTDTIQGDVMITTISIRPNTATISLLSGWTLIRRTNGTDGSIAVYWKAAGASEPSSYTWTTGGTPSATIGGVQSFRGVNNTSPINVENGGTGGSTKTPATPSITTTLANTMLVTGHDSANSGSWANPPTWGGTQGFQRDMGTTPALMLQGSYGLQAAIGASGTKTATDSGPDSADNTNTHILALSPGLQQITRAPGKIGQALKFDGITASTTVGNVSSTVKSVAFWAKVATSTTQQNIIDLNGSGANIEIINGVVTANGFTSPTIYVDGVVSSTLNNKNWHHVVVTTGTNVNASNVNLGVVGGTYFGGTLDDLRMYNRALTAAEVTRLYGLGGTSFINTAVPSNTANASGLVLQYSFDGTTVSTSTVSDVSGNGKTGTGRITSAIAFRAAASAATGNGVTTIVIDKPTGTVQGDVMIAHIAGRLDAGFPAITPPTGWTLVRQITGGEGMSVFWKVAGASEASNYTFTLATGPNQTEGGIMSFSGVDNTSPINTENGVYTNPTLTPATPNSTTTVANTMLVTGHSSANNDSWANPPTWGGTQGFQLKSAIDGWSNTLQASYARQVAVGPTGTKTATDLGPDGADSTASHILALNPGRITRVPGKIGQALLYDGIMASTTIGNVSSTIKSVAFWAKVATSTAQQNIIDLNGSGANIEIINGVVTANGFTSPTIYVDGVVSSVLNNKNWHHVVVTTGTDVNASNVILGVVGGVYFSGTLDDLRMYNRALTAAEVKRLYQLGN